MTCYRDLSALIGWRAHAKVSVPTMLNGPPLPPLVRNASTGSAPGVAMNETNGVPSRVIAWLGWAGLPLSRINLRRVFNCEKSA